MIGLTVDRAEPGQPADFWLIDEVAPSSSAAWFVRRFRCGAVIYMRRRSRRADGRRT